MIFNFKCSSLTGINWSEPSSGHHFNGKTGSSQRSFRTWTGESGCETRKKVNLKRNKFIGKIGNLKRVILQSLSEAIQLAREIAKVNYYPVWCNKIFQRDNRFFFLQFSVSTRMSVKR